MDNIQHLSLFIYDHPGSVIRLLRRHGVKLSRRPTYPEIDAAVLRCLGHGTFNSELADLMDGSGFHNFIDPVSLGLAATAVITSVTSAVIGVSQQKKARETQQALQLLQLNQNYAMQAQNIEQVADAQKRQIIINTALEYQKGLNLIATKNKAQETAVLFFSISAISFAFIIRALILKSKK